MRIDELEAREDFAGVLARTLESGWSAQHGKPIAVRTAASPGAQEWRTHPLLSVLMPRGPSAAARRFAADGFRYTPVRARAVPQWMLGTFLASPVGLRLNSRPGLWVSPGLPAANDLVVLPGNRRVRVFDFGRGRCRVFLKAGYDPVCVHREVEVRGGAKEGPFPRIDAAAPDWSWFEEAIVSGFALPRCPPWRNRARYAAEALRVLDRWLDATAEETRAADRAEALVARISELREPFAARIGPVLADRAFAVSTKLAVEASALGVTEVAASHGDFQPGNVLVEAASDRVLLSDWEHTGVRFRWYDALVWGLGSRFSEGMDARLMAFERDGRVSGGADALLPEERSDGAWRAAASSMFLLEEIAWRVEDSVSGPRTALSAAMESLLEIVSLRRSKRKC